MVVVQGRGGSPLIDKHCTINNTQDYNVLFWGGGTPVEGAVFRDNIGIGSGVSILFPVSQP